MTTEPRAFATEIDGILFGAESCAWTVHHPGQMTIAGYRRLDNVEPDEITGIAHVKTRIGANGEEHLALLRYNAGSADFWPEDWSLIAPHELVGLLVYRKD